MKKRLISLLLALVLLLTMLPTTTLSVFADAPVDNDYDGILSDTDRDGSSNVFYGLLKSGHAADNRTKISFTMDFSDFFKPTDQYSKSLASASVVGAALAYVVNADDSPDALLTFTDSEYKEQAPLSAGDKTDYNGPELMALFGFQDVRDYALEDGSVYDEARARKTSATAYSDDDITEVVIGHRPYTFEENPGEEHTREIIAIWVRGTRASSEKEWMSNFDVGDLARFFDAYDSAATKASVGRQSNADWTRRTNHRGFDVCATRVLKYLGAYYDENVAPDLDYHGVDYDAATGRYSIAYWVTGHSRGAAVANLVASYLVEDYNDLRIKDVLDRNENRYVYCYTFAAPYNTANTEASAAKYDCIFNLVNKNDFVPNVPMPEWGFTRYGRTCAVDTEAQDGSDTTDKHYVGLIQAASEKEENTYEGKFLEKTKISSLLGLFIPVTREGYDRDDTTKRIRGWRDLYVYHCQAAHNHTADGEAHSAEYQTGKNWLGQTTYTYTTWREKSWAIDFVTNVTEDSYALYDDHLKKWSYWNGGICETPVYPLLVLAELMPKVADGSYVDAGYDYLLRDKLATKFDFDKTTLINYAFGLTEPHFMDTYAVIQSEINKQATPGTLFVNDGNYTTSNRPTHTHSYTYAYNRTATTNPTGYSHSYTRTGLSEATCTEDGLADRVCSCSTNANTAYSELGAYYDDAIKNVIRPALGHNWGAPTYEWRQETYTFGEASYTMYFCTGTCTCANNSAHKLTEEAATSVTQDSENTYHYTATFSGAPFTTQNDPTVFSIHDYGPIAEYTYTWESDRSVCYAHRTCSNGHAAHEDIISTSDITMTSYTAPTCTSTGSVSYQAHFVFTVDPTEVGGDTTRQHVYESITDSIPATGHTPDISAGTDYAWVQNPETHVWTSCTAKTKCAVCGSPVDSTAETCSDIDFQVDYARSVGVYTANFANYTPDSRETDASNALTLYQETRVDDTDAMIKFTGDWGDPVSSANYKNGTARKITVSTESANADGAKRIRFNVMGKGFRIFADSTTNSGLLVMDIVDTETYSTTRQLISLYHGYTYTEGEGVSAGQGTWTKDPSSPAYYQVPVIEYTLPSAEREYIVYLTPMYHAAFDMAKDDSYEFVFDGITLIKPVGYGDTADYETTSFRNMVLAEGYNLNGKNMLYMLYSDSWLYGSAKPIVRFWANGEYADDAYVDVESFSIGITKLYAVRIPDGDWPYVQFARKNASTGNYDNWTGNIAYGTHDYFHSFWTNDSGGGGFTMGDYSTGENDLYIDLSAVKSWWYNDGAYTEVLVANSSNTSEQEWLSVIPTGYPEIYKVVVPSGKNYTEAIVARRRSSSHTWNNIDNRTDYVLYSDLSTNNCICVLNSTYTSNNLTFQSASLSNYTISDISTGFMLGGFEVSSDAYKDLLRKNGPQNMLYLAPNQSICFNVTGTSLSAIGIGAKALESGGTTKMAVYKLSSNGTVTSLLSEPPLEITSFDDLYYGSSGENSTSTVTSGDTIMIYNAGTKPLALTRLKAVADAGTLATASPTRSLKRAARALRDIQDGTLIPIEDGVNYFAGHSLTLEGDIGVNFYLDLTAEQAETATVVLSCNGEETEIALKDARPVQGGSMDGKYKVTARVAAKEMTEGVFAELFLDGVSAEKDAYTVARYAYTILDNENGAFDGAAKLDELQELCRAMLRYGSESQELFANKLEYLADVDLEGVVTAALSADEIDALGVAEAPDLSDYGLEYYGSSLILESVTTYRQYFTIVAGDAYESLTAMLGDRALPCGLKDGMFYIDIDGISASEITSSFTVRFGTVEDGVFTETHTGSFNPGAYIRQALDEGDAQLSRTVTALYRYNQAAKAYFD